MKDIPVFTTENGVAGLVLAQIPYRREAYITIHASQQPAALLEECVGFCRACGAELIYATGHPFLEDYPVYTSVLEMRRSLPLESDTDAALFPVQQETLTLWQQVYNKRMADVPNAARMTDAMAKEMLQTGDGYFVHRGDTLLGIGRASGDTLDALAAVVPGSGADVVMALCHSILSETVRLQVASENIRAIRLYEGLGFVKTRLIRTWYRVFPGEATK